MEEGKLAFTVVRVNETESGSSFESHFNPELRFILFEYSVLAKTFGKIGIFIEKRETTELIETKE